jgi:alpha-tubulin suppressor-like RCC1 family protein/uncharacterized protein (UPF0333 family)
MKPTTVSKECYNTNIIRRNTSMSDLLRKKGSVLVFSLLVLAIVLSSALSIALVNVSNRKSAASTAQSVQSFQVADTAAEKVMKAIYNGNYSTLSGVYSSLNSDTTSTCPDSVNVTVSGGTARVSFFGSNGASLTVADCTDPLWRDKLVSVKVEGSANGAVRVIETAIAPLSSMAWGANGSGQLGDGTTGTNRISPVSTIGGSKWKSVSAGNSLGSAHVLAVRANGTLWAWGFNNHNQLGDGTATARTSPVQIGTGNNWESVSAGHSHSLGIKTDHTLWAWGNVANYRLGNGASSDVPTPTSIATCSPSCPSGWKMVSAGSNYSLAIGGDDNLYVWGSGSQYRLGNSLTDEIQIPTKITACSPSCPSGWKMVSAGDNHTLAIGMDDKLYVWGAGEYGELGTGSTTNVQLPTLVMSSATWKSVSAGNNHSLGIRSDGSFDGTLWSWGRNIAAQLGNGVMDDSAGGHLPTQIGSSTAWSFVSAGLAHSFALKINGTNQELWAWGNNSNGQVGDNDASNPRLSPSQILGNWQTVEGGDTFSIGVRK